MIPVNEDTDQDAPPVCPHCEKELQRINAAKLQSGFGVRYVYSCPACRKVLGVSQRKGFWMG